MAKFLVIILVTFGSILLILTLAIRFFRNFLNGLFNTNINPTPHKEKFNNNVLYSKDDITVMKGEAESGKKKTE